MKSLLIQDTTREQREQIVRDSLGYSDLGCEDAADGYDFYQPYIDGEVELRDLSMNYRTAFVKADPDHDSKISCGMGGW